MSTSTYPILEFDPTREALIEPSRLIEPRDVPEHCVIRFFQEVIEKVVAEQQASVIVDARWEDGLHPLYEITHNDQRLAFFHPGVGGALAAGLLEEAIAYGCRKFIVCGGCGVLENDIAVGHVIVVSDAVRDEGVSYHYLPPGREVQAQINPANGITPNQGSAGNLVTINGSGFGDNPAEVDVIVGGAPVEIYSISDTRIVAQLGSRNLSGDVTVRRGKRSATLSGCATPAFCAVPKITDIAPGGGNLGVEVTVTGSSFNPQMTYTVGSGPLRQIQPAAAIPAVDPVVNSERRVVHKSTAFGPERSRALRSRPFDSTLNSKPSCLKRLTHSVAEP